MSQRQIVAVVFALLSATACRPRQAAPGEQKFAAEQHCSPCSYQDEEGVLHIVDTADQMPAKYRPHGPRDARLWSAGLEDQSRFAAR